MSRKQFPNIVTVSRIGLGIAVALLATHPKLALCLFIVGLLTDGVDGALARGLDAVSNIGGWLDVWADRVLQVTGLIAVARLGWNLAVPLAIVAVLIMFAIVRPRIPYRVNDVRSLCVHFAGATSFSGAYAFICLALATSAYHWHAYFLIVLVAAVILLAVKDRASLFRWGSAMRHHCISVLSRQTT
jgi:phosphatidylglycerophosphate synthase